MNYFDVIPERSHITPTIFDVIPGLTRDLTMVAPLQDPRFRGGPTYRDDVKVSEEKAWLTG
jgi:hypothetical protein